MNTEILCVGTELLLGDTVNTNASYICLKLAEVGIDCFYHSVVGDNSEKIKSGLDIALKRADLIIITGGLGPTDDDITMQSAADYFSKDLVFNEDAYQKVREFFESRNRKVPQKAKKQAYFPEGAEIIPNFTGTAPGVFWKINGKILIILPGVPDELYKMWETSIQEKLRSFSDSVLIKRFLKFFGIPEGTVGEKIKDLMALENPTVAPLVSDGQVNVRIVAKAATVQQAESSIKNIEKQVLQRIGEFFWGYDNDSLEKVVGQALAQKKLSVSVAESCTGGLISSRLTDISGSSSYIKLNLTTYSNEAKINTLKVNPELIDKYGAVSEPVAREMAENVRKYSKTDIGLGVTGIAGPAGGTPEKPVGLVYIGLSDKDRAVVHRVNINPEFERKVVKHRASQYALNFLRLFITEFQNISG